MTTALIGAAMSLVFSIIGSLVGLTIELHFDLAGRWEQRHIARGRRHEERRVARLAKEKEAMQRAHRQLLDDGGMYVEKLPARVGVERDFTSYDPYERY